MSGLSLASVALVASVLLCGPVASGQAPNSPRPQTPEVFRGGVEAVAISVAIRDGRGRVVRDLSVADFEVFDSGVLTPITDFFSGAGPVSLAVLVDISGSMAIGGNMGRAREAVTILTGSLQPLDEAALYSFDSRLNQVVPFTDDLALLRRATFEGRPWGSTSLFDSIGTTAEGVASRTNRHRALVVITDGVDTASHRTAAEVSALAASIDVPIYLIRVMGTSDRSLGASRTAAVRSGDPATLVDLAEWTGGSMREVSRPSDTREAVRDVLDELRHQYVVTFEPGTRAGWHPIEVRMRKKDMFAHTRGGYVASPARSGS